MLCRYIRFVGMCAKWLTMKEGYDLRALAVTVQKLKKHRTANIVRSRLLSRASLGGKDLHFDVLASLPDGWITTTTTSDRDLLEYYQRDCVVCSDQFQLSNRLHSRVAICPRYGNGTVNLCLNDENSSVL